MWILQLSDIHLDSSSFGWKKSLNLLSLMKKEILEVASDTTKIIVAICGDIAFKGDPIGYPSALKLFRKMKEIFALELEYCICPGNHDINKSDDNDFSSFNRFAWDLTRNDAFFFSRTKSSNYKIIEDTEFISVNSVYHGDQSYGLIEIDSFEQLLKVSKSRYRVVLVHHHCIPVDKKDKSTIVNSFPFLKLCISYEVKAILHGHRHEQNIMSFGKNRVKLIGVGSLFFPPLPGKNNQFNLLKFDAGLIKKAYTYRFVEDFNGKDRIGGFIKTQIPRY